MLYRAIIWSPVARITYYQVLEYLDEKWTNRELKAFVSRTEEVISHIKTNPLLYPSSQTAGVHRCVLVKQVSLFYKVTPAAIELLIFWDNHQNPARLTF